MLFFGVGRFFFGPFWFPFVHFPCTLGNFLVLFFYKLFFIEKKKYHKFKNMLRVLPKFNGSLLLEALLKQK